MSSLRTFLPSNYRCVLYYNSLEDPFPDTRNEGFAEALRLATQLEAKGICTVVDTSEMSPEELLEGYSQAVAASVLKKYRIRQVFGSKRHSGAFFGKQVPALLVYERRFPSVVKPLLGGNPKLNLTQSYAEDVFPHDNGGVMTSVVDWLEKHFT